MSRDSTTPNSRLPEQVMTITPVTYPGESKSGPQLYTVTESWRPRKHPVMGLERAIEYGERWVGQRPNRRLVVPE